MDTFISIGIRHHSQTFFLFSSFFLRHTYVIQDVSIRCSILPAAVFVKRENKKYCVVRKVCSILSPLISPLSNNLFTKEEKNRSFCRFIYLLINNNIWHIYVYLFPGYIFSQRKENRMKEKEKKEFEKRNWLDRRVSD